MPCAKQGGNLHKRISPENQRKLTKEIPVIIKSVRNNWMKEGHKNMIIYVPQQPSKYAICYLVYTDQNNHRRNEFIEGAASTAFENEHIDKCLVIAKNIDREDLPYHFIGLLEKTKT